MTSHRPTAVSPWNARQCSSTSAQMAMNRGLPTTAPPPWNGRKFLLSCIHGNAHSAGLQIVADAFQLDGRDVHYLGANVPSAALIDQVERWRPDLLCLSLLAGPRPPA